jgi:hypothetical protein
MTIRLAIASDLHVEKGDWALPALDTDLWVLAGDVGWGLDGMAWLARNLGSRRAVLIAGNREHWHHPEGTDPGTALAAAAAEIPGLTFLRDRGAVFDVGGIQLRVLGCTLWTDYRLEGDQAGAMARAGASMPDYRNGRGPDGAPLTPEAVLAWNAASVRFLERELRRRHDGPTLVVTHHLPSARSLKARRPDHAPTIVSVTELDRLIGESGPDLWVHGHSHRDCDYRIGRTRIVSRQRGGPENGAFEPLVVTL